MKIACRFGWHNWSMWSDPFEEKWSMVNRLTGVKIDSSTNVKVFTSRRCQDCREYEKREI